MKSDKINFGEFPRIWHNHEVWEDAKAGMYENPKNKEQETQIVVNYFRQPSKVKEGMLAVVNNWLKACEHNLTNPSMNKIAYLGQASVTYLFGISRDTTMYAWNFLDKKTQEVANNIAKEVLKYWEEKHLERIRENA